MHSNSPVDPEEKTSLQVDFFAKHPMPYEQMGKNEPLECLRCGRCCLADFAAYVTDDDIERWKKENRDDILYLLNKEHAIWEGDHLVSADSGQPLYGCPFFFFDGKQFGCAIHETRPQTCRNYEPGSSELCPQFRKRCL